MQHSAYWHVSRFLERWLPDRLYARALIIVIAPMVLLQTIMTAVIMERYWDSVTKALSRTLAREIYFVSELYDASPKTTESTKTIIEAANRTLDGNFSIERGENLTEPKRRPLFSLLDQRLNQYLDERIDKPLAVDTLGTTGYVDVQVELEPGVILRLVIEQKRAYASSTPLFLSWLVGSSLVLLALAVYFLRNQIRPILELARAAQNFGMGRDVPDFHPRGAAEVRAAAAAFIKMRERIERHVEQRTAMLAGVSHDLRTILTRFKLGLAFLGDKPQAKLLNEDVAEMQRMLEGYIAFVKGDGGEKSEPTDISELLHNAAKTAARGNKNIETTIAENLHASVKPIALRRCIGNLLANAARFGKQICLTGEIAEGRLIISVADDGPGIPENMREDVFKPFVRLDNARNLDESGTGLGLAITQDIVHSHGGRIELMQSPLGGLLARVIIPI